MDGYCQTWNGGSLYHSKRQRDSPKAPVIKWELPSIQLQMTAPCAMFFQRVCCDRICKSKALFFTNVSPNTYQIKYAVIEMLILSYADQFPFHPSQKTQMQLSLPSDISPRRWCPKGRFIHLHVSSDTGMYFVRNRPKIKV